MLFEYQYNHTTKIGATLYYSLQIAAQSPALTKDNNRIEDHNEVYYESKNEQIYCKLHENGMKIMQTFNKRSWKALFANLILVYGIL